MYLLKPLLMIVGFGALMGAIIGLDIWFVWRPRVRQWERENSGELKPKPVSDVGILILLIAGAAVFIWGLFYFVGQKLG